MPNGDHWSHATTLLLGSNHTAQHMHPQCTGAGFGLYKYTPPGQCNTHVGNSEWGIAVAEDAICRHVTRSFWILYSVMLLMSFSHLQCMQLA